MGASGCRNFNRKHKRPTNTPHKNNVTTVENFNTPSLKKNEIRFAKPTRKHLNKHNWDKFVLLSEIRF